MSDFYELLGVKKDATQDEIRKAYRKKAREMHPDVAGPEAGEAFKSVTQAYETLSNPEKRQAYDLGGAGDFGGFGGPGFGFSDIFETFFSAAGGGMRGPVPRGQRGQDSLVSLDITLEEATFGAQKEIKVDTAVLCHTCQGSCCKQGTSVQTCATCGGRGSVQRMARSIIGQVMTTAPCNDCQGYGTIIPEPCPDCAGDGRVRTRRTINIEIPVGVEHGTRIRLAGHGEVGPGGGPAGDLYVEIRETAHPMMQRRGDDLHTRLRIPMTAAVLGTVFHLPTLDGDKEIIIKAGTQPDQIITLHGLGVGHLHRGGRGDLYVHIEVEIPRDLDEEQMNLMKQLSELRGEELIEPEIAEVQHGVFSWLKDKIQGR